MQQSFESTPLSDPSFSGLEPEVLRSLRKMGVVTLSSCQTATIHHYLATVRDGADPSTTARLGIATEEGEFMRHVAGDFEY